MVEKLATLRIKREEGYLYYVGRDGYVWRVAMTRGAKSGNVREKVLVKSAGGEYPVKKETGYIYFLDKNGDLSRAKMARR